MIDEAITSCCGNCSGKHGVTHVNWDRDAKNSSSIKYSKQEALDAIVAGTNLALPIFRDSFEIEGDVDKSEYIMVPLLESKYVVIFKKAPTRREMANEAASIILCSLFMQYPLLVISTVLTILAAILFWFFVSIEMIYLLRFKFWNVNRLEDTLKAACINIIDYHCQYSAMICTSRFFLFATKNTKLQNYNK